MNEPVAVSASFSSADSPPAPDPTPPSE
jgi:hypothetical protein